MEHSLPDNDTLYSAYMQRDESYEGLFVVCVKTTGIFCRPTCTARKPKRENVEFFASAHEALLRQWGLLQGWLSDDTGLLTVLDGDKLIIGFETSKGERELLEQKFDAGARLAGQRLERPPMPETGHEYWPFDGEYWPDEIGYYRYTLKNACPPRKKDE